MKILLIGATGMVGADVLAEAVGRGHSVIAASRHPEKVGAGPLVEARALDATDPDAIAALAADADVIVSSVSPRGGGDPVAEALAVGEAVIAAATQLRKRLLVVGGAGSLSFADGSPVAETLPDAYRGEAMGLREVFRRLQASSLDWTYFSPAGLLEPGAKTGVYRLGTTTLLTDETGASRISVGDYAKALVDELEQSAHSRAQMTIAY